MAEIIFIVFPSPISHINGDIADTGIFVVDQRKSDLQDSLFMILNHVQGSNIDFGKYFKKRPPQQINSIRFFLLLDFVLSFLRLLKRSLRKQSQRLRTNENYKKKLCTLSK